MQTHILGDLPGPRPRAITLHSGVPNMVTLYSMRFFMYVFNCLHKYIFTKIYPMDIKVQDKISIMAYWEITSWGKKQHKMNINRSIQIKINRNQCGKSFSELYSLPSIVVSYLHVVYCVFEDKRDHSLIKDKVCLHFIFWDCPFTFHFNTSTVHLPFIRMRAYFLN